MNLRQKNGNEERFCWNGSGVEVCLHLSDTNYILLENTLPWFCKSRILRAQCSDVGCIGFAAGKILPTQRAACQIRFGKIPWRQAVFQASRQ